MDLLLKRAELCDDKAMQSVALFNMGKMLYYQGNKDKGYEFMEQAVAMMEKQITHISTITCAIITILC